MAHFNELPERNSTPYEPSRVECESCFEYVLDADEDYCRVCGDPLCEDCAQIVADETLCAKCFAQSRQAAIKSLQADPEIGDLFRLPKAA